MRLQSSTTQSPELLALFYDELATVCFNVGQEDGRGPKLFWDKSFLIWLCELITYHFQNNFIVEDTPDDIE